MEDLHVHIAADIGLNPSEGVDFSQSVSSDRFVPCDEGWVRRFPGAGGVFLLVGPGVRVRWAGV